MNEPTAVELERIANEATAYGIDPATALAERTTVVEHYTDVIVTGCGVHLSRGITGWHASITDPSMQFGTALMGGRR